jgi:hypothetical protein
MFYLNHAYHEKCFRARQQQKEQAPWPALCDTLEERLRAYPLKEYECSEERLLAERVACRVNAPLGRVMATDGAHGPA